MSEKLEILLKELPLRAHQHTMFIASAHATHLHLAIATDGHWVAHLFARRLSLFLNRKTQQSNKFSDGLKQSRHYAHAVAYCPKSRPST